MEDQRVTARERYENRVFYSLARRVIEATEQRLEAARCALRFLHDYGGQGREQIRFNYSVP